MRTAMVAVLMICSSAVSAAGVGQVFEARGEVLSGPSKIMAGAMVESGQRFVTGANAVLKLRMNDDSIMVVGEDSDLLIDSYQFDPMMPAGGGARYVLNYGTVRMVSGVMAKKKPGSVMLSTSYGDITTIGTDYIAGVCAAGCAGAPGLYVDVKSGQVKVTGGKGGAQMAATGQVVVIGAAGSEAVATAPGFMAATGSEPLVARFDSVEPSTLRVRVDTQDFLSGVVDQPASPSNPADLSKR